MEFLASFLVTEHPCSDFTQYKPVQKELNSNFYLSFHRAYTGLISLWFTIKQSLQQHRIFPYTGK